MKMPAITTLFRRKALALLFTTVSLASVGHLNAQNAVSNLGQVDGNGSAMVGRQGGGEQWTRIFSFTTGATASTFSFTGVTLAFNAANGTPATLSAGLYSTFAPTSAGGVSGLLSNLSLSSGTPTSAGNSSLSGSATLSASTTYYFAFSANTPTAGDNYNLRLAGSHNEDAGGLAGWSIANGHWYNYPNYAPNPDELWTLDGSAVQFSIQASAIPEPSTYAAIAGAAMLGLAVWQRRRRTAPAATPLAAS